MTTSARQMNFRDGLRLRRQRQEYHGGRRLAMAAATVVLMAGSAQASKPQSNAATAQHEQRHPFLLSGGATTAVATRPKGRADLGFVRQGKEQPPRWHSSVTGNADDTHSFVSRVLHRQEAAPPVEARKDKSKEASQYKSAMIRTTITVAGAAMFGAFLMATRGASTAYEFFAGYLVEQSLSIDNLFVFIMLFDYFRVPSELQDRVLSWGIAGAVSLRAIMIGLGVAAIQRFKSVILFFAGILIASSFKLLTEKEEHGEGENMSNDNFIMKITSWLFPNTSKDYHGDAFFALSAETGKRIATPLFLCLVCVELSDFVFAVDSIPAVLGVSKDPLVVYASNVFAIAALRSLYTVLNRAVADLRYLKPAVALVLGFVGGKMIAEYFHVEVGTGTSLAVVGALLSGGIIASLLENRAKNNQPTLSVDAVSIPRMPTFSNVTEALFERDF